MAGYQKAHRRIRSANVDVSPAIMDEFLKRLAVATGHPGAIAAFAGEQGARGLSIAPDSTGNGSFAVNYLWKELLSKYDDGTQSDAKVGTALSKFREAELQCGSTNLRLASMVGLPNNLAVTDIERTMCLARRKIRQVLGKLDYNHVADGFEFTSGASMRLRKRTSQIAHKYSGTPETTFGNAKAAHVAISRVPAWKAALTLESGLLDLTLVEGNCVTTVPKNYKTDRVIAIEPDMNMFVQKGFGKLIRNLLRRVGINLNSQETNQDLAYFASKTGSLATIDLSMASDTVSLELVRFLLPAEWCEALEQCRSAIGFLPSGEKVYYRKFSSMGCGFTFELESLIFYALTWACCTVHGAGTSLVSIYGDDIICPSAVAPHLIEVLDFCGFKTNEDKTFVDGPFRESCGKHYFAGDDVQPFYIKNPVRRLTDLFLLHNKLVRWYRRVKLDEETASAVYSTIKWLRNAAPSDWRRPRLPDGFGDGAFIGTFDEVRPSVAAYNKATRGWEGFVCEVLLEFNKTADFHENGDNREVLWGHHFEKNGVKSFIRHPYPPSETGRLLATLSELEKSNGPVMNGVKALRNALYERPDCCGGVVIPQRHRVRRIIVPRDSFAQPGY